MIYGCDVSSNNRLWKWIIGQKTNSFVLIKATEGRTYKNPLMTSQADYAIQKGKLIGFYHYARPRNNPAVIEARVFVNAVKPYIGRAVLALDYEGKAHDYGSKWAADFIREVKRLTGVTPMFYTSESYLPRYQEVAATGAGLWVAKYSKNYPKVSPWKFKAIWQYSDKPYDRNKFYGTAETWQKYADIQKE